MQKGVAVPLIKVPAILAVEGDHGEPGAVLLPPPDVMQPINQVGCRLFGAPVLVLEPDGVRQPAVAEEHMDRGAVGLRPVGDVEQLRLHHPAGAASPDPGAPPERRRGWRSAAGSGGNRGWSPARPARVAGARDTWATPCGSDRAEVPAPVPCRLR